MKTYKQLYPRICTWETLEIAYRKARKGKLDEIGRLLGGGSRRWGLLLKNRPFRSCLSNREMGWAARQFMLI